MQSGFVDLLEAAFEHAIAQGKHGNGGDRLASFRLDAVGNREQLYYGALPLNSGSVYVLTDTELQLLDRSSTVPVAAWIDMVFLDAAGGVITAGNQVPVL